MNLEIIILSWTKLDREGEIQCDILYMWNLKRNDTNELTKQADSEKELNSCGVGERDSSRVWDGHVYTAIYKMDNQQRPAV